MFMKSLIICKTKVVVKVVKYTILLNDFTVSLDSMLESRNTIVWEQIASQRTSRFLHFPGEGHAPTPPGAPCRLSRHEVALSLQLLWAPSFWISWNHPWSRLDYQPLFGKNEPMFLPRRLSSHGRAKTRLKRSVEIECTLITYLFSTAGPLCCHAELFQFPSVSKAFFHHLFFHYGSWLLQYPVN